MIGQPPTTNGPNGDGRDPRGRFAKGNAGGPGGSAMAARAAKLRADLLSAITDADWKAIVRKLIADAKAGDRAARAELFDRVLGKPVECDLVSRLDELEHLLEGNAR